jgi:cytochrome c553
LSSKIAESRVVPSCSTAFAFVVAFLLLNGAIELRHSFAGGDMVDMTGVEPWDLCGECHGLDGAGNRIKFPRLAGLDPSYLVGQIRDFRAGRRQNDDGQMQETVHELAEKDIPRVADWFAKQKAPWPKSTIDASPDLVRARQLAVSGAPGIRACLSCHSAASLGSLDEPFDAPRIAGQRDFYIAKELIDYRDGQRTNDPKQVMRKIAKQLTSGEIVSLAIFLSENPNLHELVVP